jgi:uncharacterized protein (TIGR02145 family)
MADFRIGGTQIASGKIKVGDSDVSKIYQGSTLVWPPAPSNCGANTTIVDDLCWTTENETSTTASATTFALSTSGASQGTPSVNYKATYSNTDAVVFTGFHLSGYSQNYSGSGCLNIGDKYKITLTDGTNTFDGVWEFQGNQANMRKGVFCSVRFPSYYECTSNTNALSQSNQYWLISFHDADFNDRTTEMNLTYSQTGPSGPSNPNYSGNQWTITVGDLNDTSYTYSAQTIVLATTAAQLESYIDDSVPAACYWDFDSNNSGRGLYYNGFAARILQPPSGYRLPTRQDWDDLLDDTKDTNLHSAECTAWVTDNQNSGWPSDFYNYSHAASSGMNIYPYGSVVGDQVSHFLFSNSADFWHQEAANPYVGNWENSIDVGIVTASHPVAYDYAKRFINVNDYKWQSIRWVKDV